LNDEIERYLFGRIDNDGSRAVEAMAAQELSRLYANFEKLPLKRIVSVSFLFFLQSMMDLCAWVK